MADYLVTDTELTSIAEAIRTKGGTSESLSFPTDYVSAIEGLPSVVQGEFTTGENAGVETVDVAYTGDGYPIACIVVVDGGAYNSSSLPWYSSMQRYAVGQWTMTKSNMSTTPTFATSGAVNQGVTTAIFKNSTTSSTSYTRTSAMTTNVFSSNNASNSAVNSVKFKSKTRFTYYVNTSSYGLLPNQKYQYIIVYSS